MTTDPVAAGGITLPCPNCGRPWAVDMATNTKLACPRCEGEAVDPAPLLALRMRAAGLGLLRVETGWAAFGLVTLDGIVARAAPIARWAVGRRADWVAMYFTQRGGVVTEVVCNAYD